VLLKNLSHNSDVQRKLNSRKNYIVGENMKEQYTRTRSPEGIGEKNEQVEEDNGVIYI